MPLRARLAAVPGARWTVSALAGPSCRAWLRAGGPAPPWHAGTPWRPGSRSGPSGSSARPARRPPHRSACCRYGEGRENEPQPVARLGSARRPRLGEVAAPELAAFDTDKDEAVRAHRPRRYPGAAAAREMISSGKDDGADARPGLGRAFDEAGRIRRRVSVTRTHRLSGRGCGGAAPASSPQRKLPKVASSTSAR